MADKFLCLNANRLRLGTQKDLQFKYQKQYIF
jgi:hypothetical protein